MFECSVMWLCILTCAFRLFITKTRLFKYIENFTSKNWKYLDKKNSDIFHISTQNIDCGDVFEQKWEIMYTPVNPSFTIQKWGLRGSKLYTVDSRYLKLQGTLWNTSRYPYFDISDLRNWGKQLIEQPPLTEWICNLTLKLEIYWKYCGKEEKLLLRSNFSSFPQYFVVCW